MIPATEPATLARSRSVSRYLRDATDEVNRQRARDILNRYGPAVQALLDVVASRPNIHAYPIALQSRDNDQPLRFEVGRIDEGEGVVFTLYPVVVSAGGEEGQRNAERMFKLLYNAYLRNAPDISEAGGFGTWKLGGQTMTDIILFLISQGYTTVVDWNGGFTALPHDFLQSYVPKAE